MQVACCILDLWPQNVKWLQQKVYNKRERSQEWNIYNTRKNMRKDIKKRKQNWNKKLKEKN